MADQLVDMTNKNRIIWLGSKPLLQLEKFVLIYDKFVFIVTEFGSFPGFKMWLDKG